jgi:AcrR family transcriptional regulator
VFWEHGYDATSISLLTGALGIGAPSLYAAFGDKETLFTEALELYLRTYAAATRSNACCATQQLPTPGPTAPTAAC